MAFQQCDIECSAYDSHFPSLLTITLAAFPLRASKQRFPFLVAHDGAHMRVWASHSVARSAHWPPLVLALRPHWRHPLRSSESEERGSHVGWGPVPGLAAFLNIASAYHPCSLRSSRSSSRTARVTPRRVRQMSQISPMERKPASRNPTRPMVPTMLELSP